jgi:hypothetical protein
MTLRTAADRDLALSSAVGQAALLYRAETRHNH